MHLQSSKGSARIPWVDTAKGLGIFFIVLGHLSYGTIAMKTFLYSFHVPLFFFLSGLMFSPYKETTAHFVSKRIHRLFVPYVFFLTVDFIFFLGKGLLSGTLDNPPPKFYIPFANTSTGMTSLLSFSGIFLFGSYSCCSYWN